MKRTTPKWVLLLLVMLLAFALVACGGGTDDSDDTTEDTTTSQTTSDDTDTEETTSDDTDTEETSEEGDAETEEEAAAEEVLTSTTITGLTSEEETATEEGYPCGGVIVGEAGVNLRDIFRQQASESAFSIRAARAGQEVTLAEELINSEGVWYEVQASGRVMGFVAERHVQVNEDCPLFDQASSEG